jgi:seryl-tRNA synthetase
MHDIRWIREHAEEFDRGLARRGHPPAARELIALDQERRDSIAVLEGALSWRNSLSKEIRDAKAKNDEARASERMRQVTALKAEIESYEEKQRQAVAALDDALAQIPNLPLDDVPDGADTNDNVEHHRFGAKREYAFKPKQHFDLGEGLGLMDFETAAKLSGARFVVLKGALARLERALMQFMLDVHTGEHGYCEVAPPLLVRKEAMFGTAQLPKFADDQFGTSRKATSEAANIAIDTVLQRRGIARASEINPSEFEDIVREANIEMIELDRLWLIPTAEVPLTNLVREEILPEDRLPLRFTAGTPCFRAEAGAAGKDTRGMIRQHQFDKVELVSITTPEQSRDEHERMLACAEEILRRLDLHYRVMVLCAGDTGFASQKTYDIEVWLPGQGAYREISSCSVCGEFQARRMHARYRGKDGRVHYVHTLNGSGVAVGRALIAVMETYQQEDGSIAVPEVLKPYMGGIERIEKPV